MLENRGMDCRAVLAMTALSHGVVVLLMVSDDRGTPGRD